MRNRPFYIIHMKDQPGFPDLDAYTHNEALAREYAYQWQEFNPRIYLFYADNILELTNDNPEYKKIEGLGAMTTDYKLEVHYYQINGFHVKPTDRDAFITTTEQWTEMTEGGYDDIGDTIQYLMSSVCNMMLIAKYIKDPMFGATMRLIYYRYIVLIVLADNVVDIDTMDADRLLELDPRIGTDDLEIPDDCHLIMDNYMDLEYLLYKIIRRIL